MALSSRAVRIDAVLLDAFGTLVDLDDPVGRLTGLLAEEGHLHPPERVRSALAGEIRFYRAHHDLGRDAATLASLRLRCAGVLAEGLGDDVPPLPRLTELLVESLRFRPLPDAPAALDALAGARLRTAVVSNWDCGLRDVLAELGLLGRIDAVVTSAESGAAKPDPAIFHRALHAVGSAPGRALHCGDRPREDYAGARAAGLRAVLLDRAGAHAGRACTRIASLAELPALVGA